MLEAVAPYSERTPEEEAVLREGLQIGHVVLETDKAIRQLGMPVGHIVTRMETEHTHAVAIQSSAGRRTTESRHWAAVERLKEEELDFNQLAVRFFGLDLSEDKS